MSKGSCNCEKVVITKQGERGPQGAPGPQGPRGLQGDQGLPGTDSDVTGLNVGTAPALGWFKQKAGQVLEFFKVLGVNGIKASQNGDDIEIGIEQTGLVQTNMSAEVTSTSFINIVVSSCFITTKNLHNGTYWYNINLTFTGDYDDVDQSTNAISINNLPITGGFNPLLVCELIEVGVSSDYYQIRGQLNADIFTFSRTDFPMTNGNSYQISMSASGVTPAT